jgi:NAD(P)-dependent dehydrogenase (short-subunit alcohol dehydrogenase family)
MALVGLMQTLALEGEKYNVRVNCLAPTAATRMTANIMPPEMLALLTPESVTPGMLVLAAENAPTRAILNAGAGVFAASHITLTEGLYLGQGPEVAEELARRWSEVIHREGDLVPGSGMVQSQRELSKAMGR